MGPEPQGGVRLGSETKLKILRNKLAPAVWVKISRTCPPYYSLSPVTNRTTIHTVGTFDLYAEELKKIRVPIHVRMGGRGRMGEGELGG